MRDRQSPAGAPHGLTVEHLGSAVLGLGVRSPRLSWQLPEGASHQISYRLEISGRDIGETVSDRSLLVSWPGGPLGSGQRVVWRVRVLTDLGLSAWSPPAWFETGLLDPEDWEARWVEPVETERGVQVLRYIFHLDEAPGDARVYATAHGIYEMFLNGRRVGDMELTPGFTSYATRLMVQVHDTTDLLAGGANIWEVVLSDGWYRGRLGNNQIRDGYGKDLAFLAQLRADRVTLGTGPGWECAPGPIRTADLMAGQVEDRRRRPGDWRPVRTADHGWANLGYSPAPPVRRIEELHPVSVTRLGEDRQIVDLGQNINGRLRLANLGPRGSEISIRHGEALGANGDLTIGHLGVGDEPDAESLQTFQRDRVISSGEEGDVFEPHHTVHGFRFASVEGLRGRLVPDDVRGVVVHTDLRRTGWFSCSDDRLNKLHEIAVWSFRDNACDIPTDCPQRERSGWTGDWQIFVPTASFLYDVCGFSWKWLRDVAAEQLANGCVTNHPPDPRRYTKADDPSDVWLLLQGSAGWGDAVVLVPWALWRAYGDREVLAEMWPSMKAWLTFAANSARTLRNPARQAERPDPRPHERYLWDGGFHWGEWLEPGREENYEFWQEDHGPTATAYLHQSAKLAAEIARVLGHEDDARRLEDLAANTLRAWQLEFVHEDGSLRLGTQAHHVRALAFDLVPAPLRDGVAARLVELIRQAGTHLGTGFLATPYLLPVLADSGHLGVAYELLLQETPPSWLSMVARGATTIWEHWNGIDADGEPHGSLNHYSKGAVISFLHEYVAGIKPLDDPPAYRRFVIAPRPGGGLEWAEGIHDSPYGRIESSWRCRGTTMELTVTVPAGTSAEIVMPDGTRYDRGPGTFVMSSPTGTS